MSNVIEYVLSMKDMLSSNFAMATHNAQKRLRELDESVNKIPKAFNNQMPSIAKAGSSLGAIFTGGFLAIAGAQLVSGLGSLLQTVGSKIVTSLFDKEKTLAGLKTFVNDDIANALYSNMSTSLASNIFDTSSLINATKGLIGAGEDAVKAQSDILSLANAILGSGGGQAEFDRMASNLQQIKTLGTATAMDIKQFGIANMNVYKILSDATGKSIAEVKEMSVSYDLLSYAIKKSGEEGGLYFGAIENYSKTLPGLWDLTKNKASKAFEHLGDALKPAISSVMGIISEASNYIPIILQKAQPIIDFINIGIISTVEGIKNLISGTSEWGDYLGIIKNIAKGYIEYWTIIYKTFGYIISEIMEFVKQSYILKDAFALIEVIALSTWDALGWIVDKVTWLWDNVLSPLLDGIEKAYRFLRNVEDTEASVKITHVTQPPNKDSYVKTTPSSASQSSSIVSNFSPTAPTGIKSSGITSSGPKSINVYIQKEMIGNLHINTTNIKEGVGELENVIKEVLYRTLISLETAN